MTYTATQGLIEFDLETQQANLDQSVQRLAPTILSRYSGQALTPFIVNLIERDMNVALTVMHVGEFVATVTVDSTRTKVTMRAVAVASKVTEPTPEPVLAAVKPWSKPEFGAMVDIFFKPGSRNATVIPVVSLAEDLMKFEVREGAKTAERAGYNSAIGDVLEYLRNRPGNWGPDEKIVVDNVRLG